MYYFKDRILHFKIMKVMEYLIYCVFAKTEISTIQNHEKIAKISAMFPLFLG